jgi:zinc protease
MSCLTSRWIGATSAALASTLLLIQFASLPAAAASDGPELGQEVSEFYLSNGLQVIVIPDHRLPVVTHSVWYKVGATDDPPHAHGLAHFVEHLMFKGTSNYPSGAFNKIVARSGGLHQNAITDKDVTYYFESLPKSRLAKIMELEADRMVNLRMEEGEIATERNVVLQERRYRIDDNPVQRLILKMMAELYADHPANTDAIGSKDEIKSFARDDALRFYRDHYQSNNAVVVIAGDVTESEIHALAENTYGRLPRGKELPPRPVFQTLQPIKVHEVSLTDRRIVSPLIARYYRVPNPMTASPLETEALQLLAQIIGTSTGHLHQLFVGGIADEGASASYGYTLAGGLFSWAVQAAHGVSADQLRQSAEGLIRELLEKGITQDELDLARGPFLAAKIYAADNQSTLVQEYGSQAAIGRSLDDIKTWLSRIEAVRVEDVNTAARKYLTDELAVTGIGTPAPVTSVSVTPLTADRE